MAEIDKNSSWYCPMPFKFLHVENDGVAPCCRIPRKAMTIEEYLSSDYLQGLQKEFLSNQRPIACQSCVIEEEQFNQSLRTQSIRDFHNRFFSTTDIDSVDYRASNVCNFKCRMCSPKYSHLINQEAQRNPSTVGAFYPVIFATKKNTGKSDDYDWILKNIGSIKRFMFAGGEPTHMPEIKSIIQKIIDSDQSDVQINFTSNCSFQDPMWYNITESLPNVHWTMSIDAVGRDAELIRHGTDWTTVGKNVRWLAQHATSIDIHSVITNLNILRLKPLLRFVRELQESSKPPTGRNGIDGARHLITVITDKHSSSMAANNWPDSMRPQVIDYITDCIATIDLQTYQKDQLTYLRDLVKDTPFNPKLWDSTNNFHHSLNIVRKENHEFLYQPAI